ncbi:MAG: MetQ/NlpA family ABC transporter substrate-binding protein [Treponema sp.]|nr:MetQ/NlpA family ABC transporter substrate-binding protein [Treponema sp.]
MKIKDRRGALVRGKIIILIVMFVLIFLASCREREMVTLPVLADYESAANGTVRKNLKIGLSPGPYGDMYLDLIQPLLAPLGYTAELIYYNDFIRPNLALAEGGVDLNMFQHYRYLNNFKMEHDLSLTAITEIPTASMGIFSRRFRTIGALRNGAVATIPDDSTNRSRALRVLDAAKIITLNPSIDMARADMGDIISNPLNIRFVQLEAQRLVESLGTNDFSVINGNFAISGGLNFSDALYVEALAESYYNVIAVRTEDLTEQFVRDIIAAVRSERYVSMVTEPGGKYAGFPRPRYFLGMTR